MSNLEMKTFEFPGLDPKTWAVHVGPGNRIHDTVDVVIDLETFGREPGCMVLEIGAAYLEPHRGVVKHFSAHLSLEDQRSLGLEMDPATVLWWMGQEDARQNVLKGHGPEDCESEALGTGLGRFAAWLQDAAATGNRELRVWGNGASFDCGILAAVYRAAGIEAPWKFWEERDLRTIWELHGRAQLDRDPGTAHSGRFDAIHELAQLHLALRVAGK